MSLAFVVSTSGNHWVAVESFVSTITTTANSTINPIESAAVAVNVNVVVFVFVFIQYQRRPIQGHMQRERGTMSLLLVVLVSLVPSFQLFFANFFLSFSFFFQEERLEIKGNLLLRLKDCRMEAGISRHGDPVLSLPIHTGIGLEGFDDTSNPLNRNVRGGESSVLSIALCYGCCCCCGLPLIISSSIAATDARCPVDAMSYEGFQYHIFAIAAVLPRRCCHHRHA